MAPHWLTILAVVFLIVSGASALVIAGDILNQRRQKMMVMNFVWPITALWAGPLGLWAYWKFGRWRGPNDRKQTAAEKPFWQSVLVGDSHCAAGCTLGDFAGEWVVFLGGFTIAGSTLWANFAFDFSFAYLVGILFQYYSIAPMRGLSGWKGIKAAVKADTISLCTFEVGMFAWMSFTSLGLFHSGLEPTESAYWFMMQIAMYAGFLTAYPANWWLLRKGIKEKM